MLTRLSGGTAMVMVLSCAAVAVAAQPAWADYVYCPPAGQCIVVVETPGQPGGGSGGNGGGAGTSQVCEDEPFPGCRKPGLGYYNPEDQCFYQLADPQPPKSDPAWQGHTDGAVYVAACGWPGATGFASRWRATPPPGFGGLPDPAVLAARAINQLGIRGPAIGIAPDPGGAGLVGLPVWMWTAVTPQTWGPVEATAAVPGLAVTARAKASRIVWRMGDGRQVSCASPGAPYQARYGNRESPTCGYRYRQASRTAAHGRYTITAVTTWDIRWWVVGGGATGELTATRQSVTSVRIDELQVVTR